MTTTLASTTKEAQPAAPFEKGLGIFLPVRLVEVDGQEEARLIQEQRVNARDEGLTVTILAGQVPSDDLVGDGEKSTMGTLRALDTRLFADASHPLVGARGRITRLACF